MRQGPNNRRPRRGSQHGGQQGGSRRPNLPNRNQSFDSNGPDTRVRGNAFQISEKYQALARDAYAAGDRVLAENYFQHAEHYIRLINTWNDQHAQAQAEREAELEAQRQARQGQREPRQSRDPSDGQGADRSGQGGDQPSVDQQHPTAANGSGGTLFETDARHETSGEGLRLANGTDGATAAEGGREGGDTDTGGEQGDAPAPRPRARRRTRRTTRSSDGSAPASTGGEADQGAAE